MWEACMRFPDLLSCPWSCSIWKWYLWSWQYFNLSEYILSKFLSVLCNLLILATPLGGRRFCVLFCFFHWGTETIESGNENGTRPGNWMRGWKEVLCTRRTANPIKWWTHLTLPLNMSWRKFYSLWIKNSVLKAKINEGLRNWKINSDI